MDKNSIFGVVYIFLSSYAIIAFCLIYDRAFDIPLKTLELKRYVMRVSVNLQQKRYRARTGQEPGREKVDQVSSLTLQETTAFEAANNDQSDRIWVLPLPGQHAMHSVTVATPRVLLRRAVKSLPVLAVKVGSFKYLERISTPDFLDFVAQSAVNLLIAFR